MNMQTRAMGGFRALTNDEIMAVSGGAIDEEGGIVVSARNPWIISISGDAIQQLRGGDAWVSTSSLYNGSYGVYEAGTFDYNSATGDHDGAAGGCPATDFCTPVEGGNGMFVRGEDGKLYLSQQGLERVANGADTNWWGVAADLAIISGGVLGSIGTGVLGIIGTLIGVAGSTLAEILDLSE